MRKIVLAFFVVSVALVACQKEVSDSFDGQKGEKVVMKLTAGQSDATKTTLDGNVAKWASTDKVKVIYKQTSSDAWVISDASGDASLVKPEDYSAATFSVGLTNPNTGTSAYAVYPAAAVQGVSDNKAKVTISATQHPTSSSFDGGSDIMISKGFTPASSVTTQFARLGAVLKISIDNATIKDEKLVSLSVTGANPLAGNLLAPLSSNSAEHYGVDSWDFANDEAKSNTVTAEYEAAKQFKVDGNYVYLIVKPQTLAKDSHLIISGSTESHGFYKDITLSSAIHLNAGHIIPLNITLTADHLSDALPFNDNMSWADNGTSDSSTDVSSSISTASDGKYVSGSKAYKGKDGLKLGTSSAAGSIITKDLDLSGAFYIMIESGQYGSDTGTLEVTVDETTVITGASMAGTNYVNIAAGTYTTKSKVTIATSSKRGYIYSVNIVSGLYVVPPVINVTSDNPLAVDNAASSQTIEYTIDNATEATLTAALQDPSNTWISSIDYSTDGEVAFEVAAQEPGAEARSAVIVLSYTGADDVEVTINQAEGAGGTTTKTFSISSADVVSNSSYSKYEATVSERDWIVTFGGNNKSVGTNSGNRSNCTLSDYSKYAVSPVTTSSIASAFASTSSISNVKKISYTFSGGSNQTNTNVYVLYSSAGTSFSKLSLSKGTQGASISSGTEYVFTKCSGYFALLFEATNSSGNWRIDDVVITFTYEE